MRVLSLSLDLDNLWSYLKTHGDAGWEAYPTYLDTIARTTAELLEPRGLRITFFVVGRDAADPRNHGALRSIAEAGHEIGNHSFEHEPWLQRYSRDALARELDQAETAIEAATGQRPIGFRGPGYSYSETLFELLAERGYRYDASILPTWLGPLARAWYFASSKDLTPDEREKRSELFGKAREGLRPLKPFEWRLAGDRRLLELPLTTMPGLRVPVHASYLLYLARRSRRLAREYFFAAMRLCRLRGVSPSLLLHPLDLVGGDRVSGLDFFPAMAIPSRAKLDLVGELLDWLGARFRIVPLAEHARLAAESRTLPCIRP